MILYYVNFTSSKIKSSKGRTLVTGSMGALVTMAIHLIPEKRKVHHFENYGPCTPLIVSLDSN